jgi:hypothetical protein
MLKTISIGQKGRGSILDADYPRYLASVSIYLTTDTPSVDAQERLQFVKAAARGREQRFDCEGIVA